MEAVKRNEVGLFKDEETLQRGGTERWEDEKMLGRFSCV